METIKDRLNKLYSEYDLTAEDIFQSPQGWKIITRTGIDKVQAKANIQITYEPVVVERDFVVIKAFGKTADSSIETFGEANNGQGSLTVVSLTQLQWQRSVQCHV